ncbi:MAG: CHAT domain-containing protein [Bacteroidota bacterium]
MTYRLDESFEQVYFNGIDLSSYLYLTQKKSIYLEKAFKIFQKRQNNRLLGRIIKAKNFKANSDPYKFENYFDREIRIIESQIRYFLNKKELGKVQYLKDQKFTLENKRDSLLFNEQLSNSEDFIDRYKTPVIELSSFQATLSPSETLLEYFRTDTALYAFAINREDVSFQKLDLPENFDPELDQFLVNSKSPPKNNTAFKEYYAGKAHELYQTLVEPLLDSLKAIPHQETSQLIIVPDGKLGYLPWDALLTEMPSDVHDYRNYPLLLKKFSIRQAYSATLMKLLEEKEMEEKSLMAAFAPAYMTKSQLAQILKSGGGEICGPPDEERFEELSQSSQELDEILTHIKGARFDTLNASETRFKEIANDFRILHLTMHGFTDDCDPMYSGLVFTPRSMLEAAGISDTTNPTNEGILHAYEIYNMRLNAELVVMSACQTGLGKIQAGEGIMSLARAFAHAGSPNTVMSLWQVQESSTRKLMENFYEYLDAGKGKDEALRLAKLDFINGNGIAHPFYWAGFTLIGDDKPIVEDNWFQKNWWMLAIGLVLLLGIYAVLRKYSSSART